MKDRKCLEDIFLVCFWGPTVTFHGYMYIYIYALNFGLGLGILSQRLGHLGMWQSMLWLQSRRSQKSSNKVGSPQQLFALVFWSQKTYIFTKMVSWKLEVGMLKDLDFFFVSQLFSFVLPLLFLVSWIVEDSKCCSYPFLGDEANKHQSFRITQMLKKQDLGLKRLTARHQNNQLNCYRRLL